MDPLLIDIPDTLETPRLVLACPRAGDGAAVAASVRASLDELKQWMPWATDAYAERDGELWCRRSAIKFLQRLEIPYLFRDRATGEHLGNVGAFAMDWNIRKAEIGYWLRSDRTGRGYMTEAVNAVASLMLDRLSFARVELRTDAANARSGRVAERCGFRLEATFRRDSRGPDHSLRDTRVYARTMNNPPGPK